MRKRAHILLQPHFSMDFNEDSNDKIPLLLLPSDEILLWSFTLCGQPFCTNLRLLCCFTVQLKVLLLMQVGHALEEAVTYVLYSQLQT